MTGHHSIEIPNAIFGAGFLGVDFAAPSELKTLLEFLKANNVSRIDTARRYPTTSPGLSETLLGNTKAADLEFVIDTKINVPPTGAEGSLTATAIYASVDESLAALGVEGVNVLHCHTPDTKTPIEETALAFDQLFKQGKFKKLGLANYTVKQIEEFMEVCEEKRLVKPSVFQGQYNALSRRPEEDLIPVLRKYGIVFNAYSPLAGGFLTGKLTSGEDVTNTRFSAASKMGAAHQSWYDKPLMHEAVRNLQEVIRPLNMSLTGVAVRWLVYHSSLGVDDGIIFGGSKISQLKGNLEDIKKGPLDPELVDEIQKMWKTVQSEAP